MGFIIILLSISTIIITIINIIITATTTTTTATTITTGSQAVRRLGLRLRLAVLSPGGGCPGTTYVIMLYVVYYII